jgi:hypothetical protein
MDKGIFTEIEYLAAINAAMRTEVERYEKAISERVGRPVTLG